MGKWARETEENRERRAKTWATNSNEQQTIEQWKAPRKIQQQFTNLKINKIQYNQINR